MRRVREIALLLLAVVALAWILESQRTRTVDSIRTELNTLGRNLCEEGARVDAVGHYNQLIAALVEDYQARKAENEARGDYEKAMINAGTIEALRLSKIVERPADCSQPLLP